MTNTEALRLALDALEKMQNAIYNIGGEHVIDLNFAIEQADVSEDAITAIKSALEAKNEKPCPEFWDWLPKAYRHGDVGDEPRFTKYNMEVAFLAGKQSAALKAKDEPVATIDSLEQEIYENTRQFVSLDVMEWMLKRYYTTRPKQEAKDEPDQYAMDIECTKCGATQSGVLTVHTTPPQRKPLTDEEIKRIWESLPFCNGAWETFARAIEAAHGIKEEA